MLATRIEAELTWLCNDARTVDGEYVQRSIQIVDDLVTAGIIDDELTTITDPGIKWLATLETLNAAIIYEFIQGACGTTRSH